MTQCVCLTTQGSEQVGTLYWCVSLKASAYQKTINIRSITYFLSCIYLRTKHQTVSQSVNTKPSTFLKLPGELSFSWFTRPLSINCVLERYEMIFIAMREETERTIQKISNNELLFKEDYIANNEKERILRTQGNHSEPNYRETQYWSCSRKLKILYKIKLPLNPIREMEAIEKLLFSLFKIWMNS